MLLRFDPTFPHNGHCLGSCSGGIKFATDMVKIKTKTKLSMKEYGEFVYPYHMQIADEFSHGGPARTQLGGDASRHFKFLCDYVNMRPADT